MEFPESQSYQRAAGQGFPGLRTCIHSRTACSGCEYRLLYQSIQQDFLKEIAPQVAAFSKVFRIFFFLIPHNRRQTVAQNVPDIQRVLLPGIFSGSGVYRNQGAKCAACNRSRKNCKHKNPFLEQGLSDHAFYSRRTGCKTVLRWSSSPGHREILAAAPPLFENRYPPVFSGADRIRRMRCRGRVLSCFSEVPGSRKAGQRPAPA